ncbi:MAG: hypothetical protein BYD32DRAFT_165863 [Podila humilis]|nr:MAG: hypothetical protein BYD32DRAFT_165863 [Podila humilis]
MTTALYTHNIHSVTQPKVRTCAHKKGGPCLLFRRHIYRNTHTHTHTPSQYKHTNHISGISQPRPTAPIFSSATTLSTPVHVCPISIQVHPWFHTIAVSCM